MQVLTARGGWAPVETPVVTAVDPAAYGRLTHQPLLAGRMADFAGGHAVLGPSAPEDGLGRPTAVRVGEVRPARSSPAWTRRSPVAPTSSSTGRDVPASLLAHASTTTFVGLAPGASESDGPRAPGRRRERLDGAGAGPAASPASRPRENNGVMAALAGLGGLYAFLSLVNAVAIGTAQRKREFAVARVTGASRRQVVSAAALESLGVSAIGVTLGSAVVAVCLLGVRHGIEGTLGRADPRGAVAAGLCADGRGPRRRRRHRRRRGLVGDPHRPGPTGGGPGVSSA